VLLGINVIIVSLFERILKIIQLLLELCLRPDGMFFLTQLDVEE